MGKITINNNYNKYNIILMTRKAVDNGCGRAAPKQDGSRLEVVQE